MRQVSDFVDDSDQFLEGDLDADLDETRELIRRLRAVNPRSALEWLIEELALESYALLQGKTFRLTIGSSGHALETGSLSSFESRRGNLLITFQNKRANVCSGKVYQQVADTPPSALRGAQVSHIEFLPGAHLGERAKSVPSG